MPEETTVQETAEKAPTGADAFSAARQSLRAQSQDQGVPAAQDDTSTTEEQPAEHTETAADQPTETAEEPNDAILTEEELAKLSPKDRANAEKWQAKLTQRGQALSAKEKEFEQWKPLIQALTEDPDSAIEAIAKERGFSVSKAAQENAVEQQAAATMAELPPELDFLKPILESYGKKLMDSIQGQIEPIRKNHEEIVSKATAAETKSTIEAFTAKYPDWAKHEPKMLAIMQKFVPAAGAITDFEYMETAYKLATADVTKAEQTKKVIERINKSAASVEPTSSGVPSERVEHAMPPPDKRSIRDAFKAASRGERWVK